MRLLMLKTKITRNGVARIIGLGLLLVPALVSAQSVTQSYGTTGTVQQGMIVMLDPANASNVTPLTNTRTKDMLGVAVSASDTPVTLNSGASGTPTYVTTSGKTSVLVSTQNGAIKAGENVSISALNGIGMKADASVPLILGKALANFNSATAGSATIQTSEGKKQVMIGLLSVDINISVNPLARSGASTAVPAFLQRIATAIAGHPVSAPRIYMSLAVMLASFLIAASLLYSGVRSSLTAIGRNPLARKSVFRGLSEVLTMGTLIFAIGLGGIYLLLKL